MKNKWEKSSWGRKLIVQKRRASLNDFDRFKVMLSKIKVSDRLNSDHHLLLNHYSCTVIVPLPAKIDKFAVTYDSRSKTN